jgi:homeobox protein cut-like
MIVADLERANSRVATVERRNELLRAEIEAMRSGNDTSDRVKELLAQVSQLETESERLSRALETQKLNASEAEIAASKNIEGLSKEIQKKTSEIEQLKLRIKQYGDYDEIKRELEIMKYVEFAGLEEDADADSECANDDLRLPNPNADKANAHHGKSLEALLATKNKRILEELTGFRILHTELEASLRAAEEQLATTAAELEKQQVLNEKLETDLLAVNKHHPNGDALATDAAVDALAGLDLGKKPSASPARTTPIPFTSSADTSILPIVTSQRDRFRQRNAELEEVRRVSLSLNCIRWR